MTVKFCVEEDLSKELMAEIAASAPANPFYTSSYVEARRLLGFDPFVMTLRENGRLMSACTAFMRSGFLSRCLEITSLPVLSDADTFWGGVARFCRQAKVSYLEVNTFASDHARLPSIGGQVNRRPRREYVLDLNDPNLWSRLSTNHQRNIKRGRQAGLQLRQGIGEQACREHSRMIRASMERRRSRGEQVPMEVQAQSFVAMTQTGAGEVFQAVFDGRVVASIHVLMADKGGYYQSAGSSPEGMDCGASHFLVHEIGNTLLSESKERFNLGGAEAENHGLERFKAGFGGVPIRLESAGYDLVSSFKKRLRAIAHLVRFTPSC